MIEIQNISKMYGCTKVVDNICATIEKGKFTSFIGPNGAGKSTLLCMINQLLPCSEGKICLEGKPVEIYKENEFAQKISILRQSNHLNLKLTIRELVSFGRFPYSQGRLKKEDWNHVDNAIAYMDLTALKDRYLNELSGGQRQRAYIAMIIAQDTEYILLDEPLNNLDMKHSVQMMKVLRKLVDDLGKTVVTVVHDINFASVYSDHIIALKDGKIAYSGTPESLMKKEILEDIYEIDFTLENFNEKKICMYY